MASEYEQLLWIGNFGLRWTRSVQLVKFGYPGGYADPAINVGNPDGDWALELRYNPLPQSNGPSLLVDPGEQYGGPQTRADYLWRLWERCKLGGDKPITVKATAPGTGPIYEREFQMRFEADELTLELVSCALYSGGVRLVQARSRGTQWSDGLSGENQFKI